MPVHYWDEKEKRYRTVDNRLVDHGEFYENEKGAVKTRFSKTPASSDALYKLEKNGRSIVWEYIPIRKKRRFKSGSVCKQEYRERLTNHELPEVHTVLRINKKHPVHVFSACVGCFQVTSLLWDILYFLTCFLARG